MNSQDRPPRIGCGEIAASTGEPCKRVNCPGGHPPSSIAKSFGKRQTSNRNKARQDQIRRYLESSEMWEQWDTHKTAPKEYLKPLHPLAENIAVEVAANSSTHWAADQLRNLDERLATMSEDELEHWRVVFSAMEATYSSHIENEGLDLRPANMVPFVAEITEDHTPATVSRIVQLSQSLADQKISVLRCAAATRHMMNHPISSSAICTAHDYLCHHQDWVKPGRTRGNGDNVFISSGGIVIFRPPQGSPVIRDMVDDLCSWVQQNIERSRTMSEDDRYRHIIATSGIAHLRYETIHPFLDGNGRTGRSLSEAILAHCRPNELRNVPSAAATMFSSGLDRLGYYDALSDGRNDLGLYGDWWAAQVSEICDLSSKIVDAPEHYLLPSAPTG